MRRVWIINGGCLVFICFWWGSDLVQGIRALRAPVAALARLPNMAFAGAVLLLALAAFGVVVHGRRKGRAADFKGNRLLPILMVVALFADLLVLSSSRSPISSPRRLGLALHVFGMAVRQAGATGKLPSNPRVLSRIADELGSPPYLVHGTPLKRYRIQVRTGCKGPITAAPGSTVGTLLYCLSNDEKTAWVSAVALPSDVTFGAPGVFTEEGAVWTEKIVARVQTAG